MSKPLRVLLVEDSENDAALLLRELRQAEFDVEFQRVQSATEMTMALDRQPWDLVISDHAIPGFGSLPALNLLQQKAADIPFLVVSGAIGEDAAVDLLKAGASDYVMKRNLARLVPAIHRELREAETRKARKRAEEAVSHLAAIVESSDDSIIGKSLDGKILSWNAGAERMYGYSADEMRGRSISVLVPPHRPEELPALFDRIKGGAKILHYETVRLRKDGKAINVMLTISPIRDANKRVVGVSSIERDITERKLQEEERLKLIQELTEALARIKTLRGLLPICSSCKKIRDDRGYWQMVETFITRHSEAEFTHGICPDCLKQLYPDCANPD